MTVYLISAVFELASQNVLLVIDFSSALKQADVAGCFAVFHASLFDGADGVHLEAQVLCLFGFGHVSGGVLDCSTGVKLREGELGAIGLRADVNLHDLIITEVRQLAVEVMLVTILVAI